MILIADSGSTKCDWMLVNGEEEVLECSTMGFNPYFHNEEVIVRTLRDEKSLMEHASHVLNVFFYGAGCSSEQLKGIVRRGLQAIFQKAEVKVGHDLDGAALAAYQGVPEIACILGTGSNSAFFDGKVVTEEIPALAYILGDEGSGSYYGKKLLSDFLYKRMPEHLAEDFFATYEVTKDIVMENVYMREHANVYLASFMKFCSRHKDDSYIRNMIEEGMRVFFNTHVACYSQYKEVQVNFVGSVAYHFEGLLRQVAGEMGIQVGQIVKKPIHGLVEYHRKYSFTGVSF